jgi:hypothetical protein
VAQAPEGVDLIELASEATPTESIEDLVARKEIGEAVARAMAALPKISARDHPEGVSRADVPGDCRHAGLSA